MYKLPSLQELLEAGVHFGHQVRRGHPRMRPFLYGARDGVHIIDLTQSEKLLKEACEYVNDLGKNGGVLLMVGTKKQAKPIIEEVCKRINTPYMAERWIGGFLTNFEEITKNIKKLKELKEQKEKGKLSKYTKKEQLLMDRHMSKLERDFSGVMEMDKLPDALFILDAVSDNTAVKEALRKNLPIVAITDSNADPSVINYPIPGNDDAIKSIKLLVEAVASAYEDGKKQAAVKKEADEKEALKKADEAAKAEKTEGVLADVVAVVEEEVEKESIKESSRRKEKEQIEK